MAEYLDSFRTVKWIEQFRGWPLKLMYCIIIVLLLLF